MKDNIPEHQFPAMTRCQTMDTIGGQKQANHNTKVRIKQDMYNNLFIY